jgi:hypothetical protein
MYRWIYMTAWAKWWFDQYVWSYIEDHIVCVYQAFRSFTLQRRRHKSSDYITSRRLLSQINITRQNGGYNERALKNYCSYSSLHCFSPSWSAFKICLLTMPEDAEQCLCVRTLKMAAETRQFMELCVDCDFLSGKGKRPAWNDEHLGRHSAGKNDESAAQACDLVWHDRRLTIFEMPEDVGKSLGS